jgi:hypothetical protein
MTVLYVIIASCIVSLLLPPSKSASVMLVPLVVVVGNLKYELGVTSGGVTYLPNSGKIGHTI